MSPPPERAPGFDERLLYLPDCYCPSDTRRPVAARPDRARLRAAAQRTGVLLLQQSLQDPAGSIRRLDAPARRGPGERAVALACERDGDAQSGRGALRAAASPAARLVFAPRVTPDLHLARHAHADLYLDTYPYNAGTAANDALLMGVPVLTCSGDTMASRVAGSQLRAIGLPELVTGESRRLRRKRPWRSPRDRAMRARGCGQARRQSRQPSALRHGRASPRRSRTVLIGAATRA